MPTRRSSRLLPLGLAAMLAGCAAGTPIPQPSELPMHAVESPFTLHWRTDRGPDRVTGVGVVETRAPARVAYVIVELQGLDRDGRVVSRARTLTAPRSFAGTDPWPFTVSLRPTGQEERFVATLAEVAWRPQMGGR
jgi:hypothetical protein